MFWNVLECFGMFWNVLECFGMFWNVLECFDWELAKINNTKEGKALLKAINKYLGQFL